MSTVPPFLSSVQSLQKYGISKWTVRHASEHIWSLDVLSKEAFSKYYILYWSPKHLNKMLRDGVIEHQKIQYQAIFFHCSRDSCSRSKQVALSFRVPKLEYDLPPVVLISSGQVYK